MSETETNIITQNEGERFAIEHNGGVALYGAEKQPPMQHKFGGQIVHTGTPQQPLVHMVCWDEEDSCHVQVAGNVVLTGDPDKPVHVHMRHEFANTHQQTHAIEPMDHSLKVDTRLAEPIHHALQMRTPLQLRFCNPWHIVSDYVLDINLGNNRVISVRLTGATVATPQPCADENCPPPTIQPDHP